MGELFKDALNTDLPRRRKINIPESVRFGLEIENNGIMNLKELHDAERVLYNLCRDLELKDDRSLSIIDANKAVEYGIEIATPVMNCKKDNIELLKKLSATLKHINPKYNLSSFQVNLDDNFDDKDRLYFLKLYTYFEPIIARFCRGNDPTLRAQVCTYADATYYKMMNSISLFDHPSDIVETFTENKMLAVNFKKRPRRIIEFRLPNGTNEYTLWFNYINAFYNMVRVIEKREVDERYLDIKLKREKEKNNTSYKYNYKCFNIKEELAEEFVKTIFEDKEDRYYFLQQYANEGMSLKKAL